MSYRGDLLEAAGSTALGKGIGAVAGLAGTAIGGPLGGLVGVGLGAILGSTLGQLFGESPEEASDRIFQEQQKRIGLARIAYLKRLSPAQRRRMRRNALALMRMGLRYRERRR